MNNILKIGLGALIGGGVGYLIGEWYVETHILPTECDDTEWEEEIETEAEEKPIMKRKSKKNNNGRIPRVRNYTQYFQEQNRPDILALVQKYNPETQDLLELKTEEALEADEILEEEVEFTIETETDKDPSIISMETFANSEGYSVTTLNYYADDVLTDENDNPIDRPEKFLGNDALVSFGQLSGDEDVVYVRNEEKRALYEIVRLHKPYSPMDAQLRRKSKQRRMVKKESEENEEKNTE